MRKSARELLSSYIDALYPIIYINHFDFKIIDQIITDIVNDRKILEYQAGLGSVDFASKALEQEIDLTGFLHVTKDFAYNTPVLLVLKDIHKELEKMEVISLLKYIAERNMYNEDYNACVFIVSSKLYIPTELEDLITVFDIPLPGLSEIKLNLTEFIQDMRIYVPENVLGELAVSFKGLNEFQIRQILNLAYQDGGCLDFDDKQLILGQKEQLIKKVGLLEMIPSDESVEDIGGLENLKEWLYQTQVIFNQLDKAMKFGVDIPKGIMIVGMPGCGKSLVAS